MFISALFTIAKLWNQDKYPSVDEWIKKIWCIHTRKFYSTKRKSHCLWEIIMSIEDRVRFRKTRVIYFLTHVEFRERKDIKIKRTVGEKGTY
jgi:Iap family predicted aminopeptidase